jgi:hypothetical protein
MGLPMKKLLMLALMLVFLPLAGAPAQAAKGLGFGSDEKIRSLTDIKLRGPSGETLFLAHKVTTQFFLLGVHVKDDGYVLGVQGDSRKYFRMPADTQVSRLQQQGLLPRPLPGYRLGTIDYLIGYSLWLALAAMGAWFGFKRWASSY